MSYYLGQITVELPSDVPPSNPYPLTPDQIADVLSRNVYLGQIITNAEVNDPNSLKIGISFTDSKYGNIIVSTDAGGYLRVIANSPLNPDIINAPAPTLPPEPGNPCFQSFDSFFGCLKTNTLGLFATLILGYILVNRLSHD